MIRLEHDGAVARLLIDRADKRNAVTLAMWQQIPPLLAEAATLPDVRVLLVQAASPGGAFCAGADIGEMLANKGNPDWLAANQAAMIAATGTIADFPLPTIAFVDGEAVGAGCAVAMACDVRVAAPAARFGVTPAKLGLVYPIADLARLVDLVGPGQARRLLFSTMLVDAAEARAIGLVETLAETPDALVAAMAAASRHSTRALKSLVRRALAGQRVEDDQTGAAFLAAFAGADFAEGAAAFAARRPPQFRA